MALNSAAWRRRHLGRKGAKIKQWECHTAAAMTSDGSTFVDELVGGWAGRTHAIHPVAHPADISSLQQAARQAWASSRSVIAKGAGCSYADQITNRGGAVVDCSALSGIRSWDPETGRVVAWAGTPLAEILRVALPAGWTIPGVPGSFAVTVGGAIANNVHGKDAHRQSFGSALRQFELLEASSEIRSINPETDGETFHAVIGGLGLLGIVVSADLQLVPIPSAWVEVETVRTKTLADTLRVFERRKDQNFALAWLDGLTEGGRRGRGVVWFARWVNRDTIVPVKRIEQALTIDDRILGVVPKTWVWRAGSPLLRPPGLRATNTLYHLMASNAARRTRIVPFPDFYFLYNRINGLDIAYRPNGFTEIQALLPPGTPIEVYRTILDTSAQETKLIFAAMKGHVSDPFLLSFPSAGQSFTIGLLKPVGNSDRFRATLRRLYEIVIAAGGRVNLSKDEFLSADQFHRMYKNARAFRDLKRRLDPDCRFQSDQFRRLFEDCIR